MTMGDVSERSTLHSMRREQERERRRMRDRERRQSMTLEQREKHLARRRRNYQLRRQRNKHLEYNYQPGPSETASSGEVSERSEKTGEIGNRCRDMVPVGFNHILQETDTDNSKYEGKSSQVVRLNRLKRIARAANSASKKNAHQQHQSETNDTDLSNYKIQPLDSAPEEKAHSNGNHQ